MIPDYTTYTILELCEALANVEVSEEQLSAARWGYSSRYDSLRAKEKAIKAEAKRRDEENK